MEGGRGVCRNRGFRPDDGEVVMVGRLGDHFTRVGGVDASLLAVRMNDRLMTCMCGSIHASRIFGFDL